MHDHATMQAPGAEAMSAIRQFALQISEMTDLACRMQDDIAAKLSAAETRMQAAARTISDGEARIAARMAEFTRQTEEAAKAAERQTTALHGAMQEALRRTTDLAAEAVKPLKAEAEAAARRMAENGLALRTETQTLLAHMKEAGSTFNARAETAVKLQSERLTEAVGNAFLASQAKLGQTTEALNAAAASLAGRVLEQTHAQSARSAELETLAGRMAAFAAAVPDASDMIRREASAEAAVQRMQLAADSVKAMGSGLAETAMQLQGAALAVTAASQERQAAGARAADERSDAIRELSEGMRQGFARLASERNDVTTEILTRIDEVAERIKAETRENAEAGGMSGARQVFDAERGSIMRLSAAFRLVMKDMSSEHNKLGDVVQSLALKTFGPPRPQPRLPPRLPPGPSRPTACPTSAARRRACGGCSSASAC
jgi:hypothetical protein